MANTPTQDQLLAKAGRAGWTVVSTVPSTETIDGPKVDVETGKPIRVPKYPEGSETWIIGDGQGHNQTMIAQQSVRGGYAVVEPPKDMPTVTPPAGPSNTDKNEGLLNDERSYNATNTKWGRVTHQEKEALIAKEAATGRQLSQDEIAATRQASADTRAANNDARTAANQSANTAIAAGHLALAQQNANKGELTTVKTETGGTNIVRTMPDGSTSVVYSMPAGVKIETTQDGSIIAIDPANPTAAPVTIYKPAKPPAPLAGGGTKPNVTFVDPTTGELTSKVDPGYTSPATQRFQELQDGIDNIQAMWTRGEITPDDANKYKDLLRKNFDASLRGTTPYQEHQDKQQREQTRMTSGQSLLNQRVQSGSGLAQSLLGSAVDIAGNKNMMDPSAFAGFSPFAGAADYVTQLGGGQGVYDAATGAVTQGLAGEQSDPATTFLNAALGGGATGGATGGGTGGGSYGGENVGSGAASNPQPSGEVTDFAVEQYADQHRNEPGMNWDLARQQLTSRRPPVMAGATDPGLALLKAALGGRSSGPQYT